MATPHLEEIVRSCIIDAATTKSLSSEVTGRLVKLVDDVAAGELDPDDIKQVAQRIDLILKGFDAAS